MIVIVLMEVLDFPVRVVVAEVAAGGRMVGVALLVAFYLQQYLLQLTYLAIHIRFQILNIFFHLNLKVIYVSFDVVYVLDEDFEGTGPLIVYPAERVFVIKPV